MSKKNDREHDRPGQAPYQPAGSGGATATARAQSDDAGRPDDQPGQGGEAGPGHGLPHALARGAGEMVSGRPMTSVLTGFGLGFGLGLVLAMLLEDRDSRRSRHSLSDRFWDYADSLKDLPHAAREYLSHVMDRR